MSTTSAPSAKLGAREKLFFGFGDLGSCLFWNSFQTNLQYFYTDVFGITHYAVSALVLFGRIWDGVNDPMVGALADRTKTRWGRYRPYILWFSVPLCIAGVFMFTTPNYGYVGKIIWAWVTYNCVMMLYTLVNIPYTALLGTISPDAHERASTSTYKFGCAFTAGIIVAWIFMPMTRDFAHGDQTHGWQMAFLVIAAIALPFFLLCFAGTRERVTPAPGQKTSLKQDLKDLVANKAWVVLLGVTICFVFYTAGRSTVMNYYLKYFVVGSAGTVDVALPVFGHFTWDFETLQSRLNASGQIASLVGILIVGLFVKRMEKKWNFLMWFSVGVVFTAWTFWLKRDQVEMLLLTNVIGSMAGAPICVLIWAMYSDAAEYSEWKNNRQAAGLVFSASTFAQKVGWGVGPALVGLILGKIGFAANVEQSPVVLHWLVLFVSLVPAAFGLLSMAFVFLYPLDDKKVEQMSSDLKLRRTANGHGDNVPVPVVG